MARGSQSGGEAFARKLNALMEQSGFSQAYVAEQIGVWDSLVSRWRKGKGIDVVNVRKLADLFGVDRGDMERLAGYSDNPLSSDETRRTEIELERQLWRARYDDLIEKKVPGWAREAYIAACEALAEAYNQMRPGELSSSDHQSLSNSAAISDTPDPDARNRDLADTLRPRPRTQQFTVVAAGA